MASKWATEKAREMLRMRFIRHDEANTYSDAMVFNATVPRFDPTPDFEQLEEFLAAALDAARQEGKREMRERAARASCHRCRAVGADDGVGFGAAELVGGKWKHPASGDRHFLCLASSIRALPLEDR